MPPFDSDVAIAIVEKSLGAPIDVLFDDFERVPVASASIAQVHFAKIKTGAHAGKAVAVKVLRPNMLPVIDSDLALLRDIAYWTERLWADGKRLKPREVVAEFDKYLHDELDLMREAANGSQLRRNFAGLDLLMVPEMYWDFSAPTVLVMERMVGVPISQVEVLRAAGVDIPKLAQEGVEIFFTQVFRDGFFHADMHPGNIQVSLAERRSDGISRWISGLSARCPTSIKTIWRKISWRSSSATITGWPRCIWSRAGFRRAHASKNWKALSAPSANRTSTGR